MPGFFDDLLAPANPSSGMNMVGGLNALMADPAFQNGLGMLGASSWRNKPLLDAYNQMQTMKAFQLKNADVVSTIEHRKQQIEVEKEKARLYGEQVATAEKERQRLDKNWEVLNRLVPGLQPPAAADASAPTPATPAAPVAPVSGPATMFPTAVNAPGNSTRAIAPDAQRQADSEAIFMMENELQKTNNPLDRAGIEREIARIKAQHTDMGAKAPSSSELEPWRKFEMMSGWMSKDPAKAAESMSKAYKPDSNITPGSFARDSSGNLTQIPNNPLDISKVDLERQRVEQERQKVELERLRTQSEAANREQQMQVRDQEQKQKLAKDTGFVGDALSKAQNTVEQIDELMKHPGLNHVTGAYAGLPAAVRRVVDPSGMDAKANLESMKSQIKLSVITSLKALSDNGSTGFGQLSDKEGAAIESSIAALDDSQTTEQLTKNMTRVKSVMQGAADRISNVYRSTWGDKAMDVTPKKSGPSQADLEFTARKHGISVDEVKKRLGVQ